MRGITSVKRYTWEEELDLVKRLMALRKRRLIGPWQTNGREYFVCPVSPQSEINPTGHAIHYPKYALEAMIKRIEREASPIQLELDFGPCKPVGSEKKRGEKVGYG